MLSDKYTPYTLNGIIGNKAAVARVQQFGADSQLGKHPRPIMIYGPSGTGKTVAARALAYMSGFEIMELNSSDYRDVETLTNKVLPASRTKGLFSKRILILFDEIDELSGKFDSGAERVINQLVRESRHPIIFTANDYWDRKISFLRNSVDKVEFRKISNDTLLAYLKGILVKEGKSVDEHTLAEIAKRSDGDVRGALNDLELMIDAHPDLMESLGMRNRKMQIFGVLDRIFFSSSFESARLAITNSDIDMGMLINWIDENIPNRYRTKKEIMESYANLSKASSLYERASRINYYGYLRYASVMLSSGVSLSSSGNASMLTPYSFPARIQHMSRVKKDKGEMTAIAIKLTRYLHSNTKEIIRTTLPLISAMIEQAKKEPGVDVHEFMQRAFALEPEETDAITKHFKFSGIVS